MKKAEFLPAFNSLGGSKVLLKPFESSDITQSYIDWLNDPQVVGFSNQRFRHHSFQSCHDFVSSFKETNNRFLKIVKLDDETMIGTMTAYGIESHDTVDMGIMIGDRSVWGHGLGQDAWNILLEWLLGVANVRKVTGGTMRANVAMVRIMERSGMKLEAIRPGQELLNGEPQDLLYFGKFRASR